MKKIKIFFIILFVAILLIITSGVFSQGDTHKVKIPPPSELPEPGL